MNLVVSGPIDASLLDAVAEVTVPATIATLHAQARRLEHVRHAPQVRQAVATLCESACVDHAFVDHAPGFASFGLLAMDMDSTFITIECIDEIADFVGKKSEVSAITEAAMRGEITDFAESLRRRVALLAGADADVLRRVFDERLQVSPGANALIAAAQMGGTQTLLVSGGFTYFSDRLVAAMRLDAGRANVLEVIDGRLTGRVVGAVVDAEAKARIVEETMKALNCNSNDVVVIGDGSNDIPMMQAVTHSVAYHAKPAVVSVATHAVHYGTLATVADYFS